MNFNSQSGFNALVIRTSKLIHALIFLPSLSILVNVVHREITGNAGNGTQSGGVWSTVTKQKSNLLFTKCVYLQSAVEFFIKLTRNFAGENGSIVEN